MIVETIIGVIVISIALFSYFVGKDVKEKDIQDGVLDDISKAKKVSNKVDGFRADDIIDRLSKYKK